MSGQKSHVSPSECKKVNPSISAQFFLVDRAQGDHSGRISSIRYETHIDIFKGDDEGDVGRFDDCWRSLTLTPNPASGICRTNTVATERMENYTFSYQLYCMFRIT